MHRCLHGIMHLIEDHAENAGIPVRFAAAKVAEGDAEMEKSLYLEQNETEMIEHIVSQMEEERGIDRAAAIADMRFDFIQRIADKRLSNRQRVRNVSEAGGSMRFLRESIPRYRPLY